MPPNKRLSIFFILMGLAILMVSPGSVESFPPRAVQKVNADPPMSMEIKSIPKNSSQISNNKENFLAPGQFYLLVKPEAIPHKKNAEWLDLDKDVVDKDLREALKKTPGLTIRRIAPVNFEVGDMVFQNKEGFSYDATQEFALYTAKEVSLENIKSLISGIPCVLGFFQFSKIVSLANPWSGPANHPRSKPVAGPGKLGFDDPLYAYEWRYQPQSPYGINFEDAWENFGITGENTVIGIIDGARSGTGVLDHPDIVDQIIHFEGDYPEREGSDKKVCFQSIQACTTNEECKENICEYNCFDHGAFVAQQMVAMADNGYGTRGAAYGAVLKFFNRENSGSCGDSDPSLGFTMLDTIYRDHPDIDVLNLSWGPFGTGDDLDDILDGIPLIPTEFEQYNDRFEKIKNDNGTAIFTAAGNSNKPLVRDHPFEEGQVVVNNTLCFSEHVLCVGGTDQAGQRAIYDPEQEKGSNYNPEDMDIIMVAAPIMDFPLERLDVLEGASKIQPWGGTSSAAPMATAVGALVSECLQYYPREFPNPGARVDFIYKTILCNTTEMAGDEFPLGIINAAKAVESACTSPGSYDARIAHPAPDEYVTGTLEVHVETPNLQRGGAELDSVELYLDREQVPEAGNFLPGFYLFPTENVSNGEHYLYTIARYSDGMSYISHPVNITFDNVGAPPDPGSGGGGTSPADPREDDGRGGPVDAFITPHHGDVVTGRIPVDVEVVGGGWCPWWWDCMDADQWNIEVYANGEKIGEKNNIENSGEIVRFWLETSDYKDFESIRLEVWEEPIECTRLIVPLKETCWSPSDPSLLTRITVTAFNGGEESKPSFKQPPATFTTIEGDKVRGRRTKYVDFEITGSHPEAIEKARLWERSWNGLDQKWESKLFGEDAAAPFIFSVPLSSYPRYDYYFKPEIKMYGQWVPGDEKKVQVTHERCSDGPDIVSPGPDEIVDDSVRFEYTPFSNPCHLDEDIRLVEWEIDGKIVTSAQKHEPILYDTSSLSEGPHIIKAWLTYDDGLKEDSDFGQIIVFHDSLPPCTKGIGFGDESPAENEYIAGGQKLDIYNPGPNLQWVQYEAVQENTGNNYIPIDYRETYPFDGFWKTQLFENDGWYYRAKGLLENGELACTGEHYVVINNPTYKFECEEEMEQR